MSNTALIESDFPFFHVFQPVMDLRDDSIYGFEVLLRSPDGRNPELIFAEAKEQGGGCSIWIYILYSKPVKRV
ncbi:hypothetical protein RWE15_16630 [Virgibacillus halophilus]|uniref:EAL domain-containing protein n=1 Tax=Tigheibacillus halophilus TaxID=361280 RepID=A0ABU5C946_9BACI|nr:hypothetical protein [Virgibacillus halophilus]